MTEPRLVLDGLAYVECPRWHDGRLWFAHWGTDEIVAVNDDGGSEVMAHGSGGLGWSFDWLPDGTLLTTGAGLQRVSADGSLQAHAKLGEFASDWNELVVDGRGNAYANGGMFGPPDGPPAGVVALVRPDGSATKVADALAFPNGMAVTPDNRTLIVAESWAEQLSAWDIAEDGTLSGRRVWAATPGDHPDGICADADGAIWYADVGRHRCVRVREGGNTLQVIELDRAAFACMLGGDDRRTLFILAAEWGGFDKVSELVAKRTGQVLAVDAPAVGVGWP
jgi:sugar lactone lactonase YvrE